MKQYSLSPHRAPMRRAVLMDAVRGFTLIELMITVAIIGMLAALAYPAYTGSILKGRRAEGRAALTDLLQQQERYLTQTGSYMKFATGATGANGTVHPAATGRNIPFKSKSGETATNAAYQLEATECASGVALNECILLRAVPTGSDPEVGTLTLMSTGAKSCNGTTASTTSPKCWR